MGQRTLGPAGRLVSPASAFRYTSIASDLSCAAPGTAVRLSRWSPPRAPTHYAGMAGCGDVGAAPPCPGLVDSLGPRARWAQPGLRGAGGGRRADGRCGDAVGRRAVCGPRVGVLQPRARGRCPSRLLCAVAGGQQLPAADPGGPGRRLDRARHRPRPVHVWYVCVCVWVGCVCGGGGGARGVFRPPRLTAAWVGARAGADVYQCAAAPDGLSGAVTARHVPLSSRQPVTYAAQHVSNLGPSAPAPPADKAHTA
jgi:hypothetical protein